LSTEEPAEASEPEAALDPEPAAEIEAPAATSALEEPGTDLAAELLAAEETAAEEVRALLVAVLDRLGSAHHRPFSRS
jgi:hypothetical protein